MSPIQDAAVTDFEQGVARSGQEAFEVDVAHRRRFEQRPQQPIAGRGLEAVAIPEILRR